MIDNYVRDSENVIKMYLTSTGTGDAILEKNISLYVGSYQNKLINVFIPKSILFENEENTFNYAVSVSAIMTSDTGKKITSKPYYLSHLKDASLLDPQTQEMTDYVVLERVLPKEFTVYVGTTTVVINVINLDNTDDPTTLDIITSQVCYLQVQESDYADDEEEIEPSEFQTLVSRVTTLEANVDLLDNVISTGENFVTSLTENKLPTNEELDAIVINVEQRPPRNGDVIIFTLKLENETDKSYKYFYSVKGWDSYQIPLIEPASNGSLGIVQGTYSTSDEDVTTTEVNIRNGKILNVYVGLDGEKQELGKIFNETLPNKYLNQEVGASKQFVKDYAMPRQFNDVDFIASTGYQDNVPTEPESGVQFTKTTDGVGDFEIFQIEKTNTADFELSSKNGYSNTIYISANANCKVIFRLTTRYKKVDEDWRDLNIELSNAVEYEANDIQKVVFSNPFTYLGEDVVDFKNGDMIQQTLEVITQTSVPTTFSVYSNEVYPSSFTLTSQYFVPSATTENIAKILVLGVDGIIESNRVIFEVQNANDLVEFRTNQREFLLFGYLPIVGTLDDSLPVNITFGDTTYNVYTFMNGGNQPITIGDLKSVMSYNQETGYRFYPKMIFIETADIQGFVVEPSTVTASQLINIIDDTDTIVISLDNNKVKLNLSAEIVNKLSRMLVTPMSKPTSIELVGIGTDNMQVMLELGDGFSVENGKINVTARGESYDDTEIRGLINELQNDKADIDEIPMTASDVGALPDTTKYGAGLDLTIDETTYVVTVQLKDQDGNNLGQSKTIDLPLESVVVSGRYDDSTQKVTLILQNGTEISFSVADLVSGLQSEIADLDAIRSNASAGKSASDTIKNYGDIVTRNASEFAKSTDLSLYLPLSGGTVTGATTFNKGIAAYGTNILEQLILTSPTHETSNPVRIAVITSSGHIWYRTPTEMKSDLGVPDTSGFAKTTDLANYLSLTTGGTMSAPLILNGGDATTAGNIQLLEKGQITDGKTATLFGRVATSPYNLIVGHSNYVMQLRGKNSKVTYNGNNLALESEIPKFTLDGTTLTITL